ncbi:hypothetical protein PP713_08570 [Mycobacterium sp. CSUR Q5927]|nr:hypothetical protein [Mycobacterium sp. CSUR Q5927]
MSTDDERVARMRACRHNLRHYVDANGNRRCYDCRAFVRPVEGSSLCEAPGDGDQ